MREGGPMDKLFGESAKPTRQTVFPTRICRAVVNPVEKYEDTLSPSQREAEIMEILTGIAARILREHLAGRPADEKSQLNLLESAKQSQV
jgi:hypothetical protein